VPAASLHRPDGKKLPFVAGFLTTELLEDQQYLDHEIYSENPYLRPATDEEVHHAKMRLDPRGTIRQEVEGELRLQLEREFQEKLEAELAKLVPGSVGATQLDGVKLAGTDTVQQKIAAAKDAKVTGNGNTVIMEQQKPVLQGIVGTDKTTTGVAAAGAAKK
jgi:hypothetical protein